MTAPGGPRRRRSTPTRIAVDPRPSGRTVSVRSLLRFVR